MANIYASLKLERALTYRGDGEAFWTLVEQTRSMTLENGRVVYYYIRKLVPAGKFDPDPTTRLICLVPELPETFDGEVFFITEEKFQGKWGEPLHRDFAYFRVCNVHSFGFEQGEFSKCDDGTQREWSHVSASQ